MPSPRDGVPKLTTHGCGKSWRQVGNRTSHCGRCHTTFGDLGTFDAHFRRVAAGVECRDPGEMVVRGLPLKFDGAFGDGVWSRQDAAPLGLRARVGRPAPSTRAAAPELAGASMRGAAGQRTAGMSFPLTSARHHPIADPDRAPRKTGGGRLAR